MPFNGSGTFLRLRNWVQDAAASIRILADRHDSEDDNFAQGLSQCITKDGQTTISANLPMSNYRHTNVGEATAITQYARYDQLQLGKAVWADAGGTADAITATYNPNTSAPVDGQLYYVRATAANTTTTPTFSPDGNTAQIITKLGAQALGIGDIAGDGHELILRYRLSDTKYELLNAGVSGAAFLSANNTFAGTNTFQNTVTLSGAPLNLAKGTDVASASTTDIWAVTGNQIDITGTATITSFGTSPQAGVTRMIQTDGACTFTNNANIITSTGANIVSSAGQAFIVYAETTTVARIYPLSGQLTPTAQYLTTGTSATYTTPTGCKKLFVRMVGAGGGGGAQQTNVGQAGGDTIFNSINAKGGSGGSIASGAAGGTGGTGGTGTASFRLSGADGVGGPYGGPGAGSFFAGGGSCIAGNGQNAKANTGAGGGGAWGGGGGSNNAGGGGAGEYVEIIISNPSASYTYTIGASGNGGAAGTFAGGNGGSGLIIVEEYY